jgi:small subunit ribosomal protein S20
MANLKSSIRRIKTSARNHRQNLVYLDQIKKLTKDFKRAPSLDKLRKTVSILDKAALKGILPKNASSRKKSQLMKILSRAK